MAQQREQTQETLKESIILNRMYDGKYIHHNLGHEVINLFTEDKGRHYIYLNSDGKTNGISYKYMLLIKRHCQGIIEIIGKAINIYMLVLILKRMKIKANKSMISNMVMSRLLIYSKAINGKVYMCHI